MFFSGLLCHRDDACISNPCREGSQCDTNPISGMFNCNCPPGYVGNTCNTDRDECSIGKNDKALNTHNMHLCQTCDLFCFQARVFPLHHQVPTLASTVVSAWTLMAPSPVTVSGVILGRAVNKMSTSVLRTPARTMAHVWIALETTPASACLVHFWRNYKLPDISTFFIRHSHPDNLQRSAAFVSLCECQRFAMRKKCRF